MLLYKFLNLDKTSNLIWIGVLRLLMEIYLTRSILQPDEYWQGTEVAYDMVYGGVKLSWEWRDEYRIRNILYPAFLSIPLWIFKILGIDT